MSMMPTPQQRAWTEAMEAQFPGLGAPETGRVPPLSYQATGAPKMSRGQMILGILGDALAGAAGRQGQFAQHLGQLRQQEQAQAKWGLQRQAGMEDYERKRQIDARYDKPDVSPMERDLDVWTKMSPDQRTAWQEMQRAKAPDPDVVVPLPNGSIYAGPRSGLSAALTGGGTAPQRPVGRLTPINGGPTPPASGPFRP